MAGVESELRRVAGRYRLVAILTGRRSEDMTAIVEVPGVIVVGLYGFDPGSPSDAAAVAPEVRAAAAIVPEAWVEDKGVSLAVHYRQAPDPARAQRALLAALQPLAAGADLEIVEGKMVLELVPAGRPMKGRAIERLVEENGLEAVLYAGDDVADLDAFHALGVLDSRGIHAVRVAVRGEETPEALVETADIVVDGPDRLVDLLRSL